MAVRKQLRFCCIFKDDLDNRYTDLTNKYNLTIKELSMFTGMPWWKVMRIIMWRTSVIRRCDEKYNLIDIVLDLQNWYLRNHKKYPVDDDFYAFLKLYRRIHWWKER